MKNPGPEEQRKPFQIPENNPAQDEVPLEAFEVVTDDVVTRYRNMLDPVLAVATPAAGTMSALATVDLGKVSLLNQLGTTRPAKVIAALDATKRFFYIIPVAGDHEGGIEVVYDGSRCGITLYKTLAAVDRLVPEGMRDYYPLKPTPNPIKVGKFEAYGLYCKLANVTTERMGTLSEETKAKRAETRRRNKEKKSGGDVAATGD